MSEWTDIRKRLKEKKMSNNDFQRMKMQAQRQSNLGSLAPNLLPGVGPNDLIGVKCNNCSGEVFAPAHLLKFASRFQSRNSQPTMVQFPLGFMCVTCNQINPFDIEQLQKVISADRDQDGQKLSSKEKTTDAPADLGVSVDDGVTTKEKLN